MLARLGTFTTYSTFDAVFFRLPQNIARARRFAQLQGLARSHSHLPVGHKEDGSQDLRIAVARPRHAGHSGLAGLAGGASGKCGLLVPLRASLLVAIQMEGNIMCILLTNFL